VRWRCLPGIGGRVGDVPIRGGLSSPKIGTAGCGSRTAPSWVSCPNSSCSALFGTGLECRVSSVECRVSSVECRVPSAECRVPSVECQVIKPKKLLYSFFLILWPIYTHRKSEKNKPHFHVHIFALIIPLSVRLFSFCRGSSARLARREQTNRR